ncbi:Histamine H1 receptor [Frankliniella fusca]|uniref:Histamine H1 receptor n=1 Tax=Frankliniella fusca TaxID=407009 RepID=A0AAE1HTF7_9NEOP|nr:Histamine H1 receptor [Frankliniella fusca]
MSHTTVRKGQQYKTLRVLQCTRDYQQFSADGMAEAEEAAEDAVVAVLLWSGRVLLLLLLVLGAIANAVALVAFCRGPGLRTLSNRFVINLLVVNVTACALLLPLLLLESTNALGTADGPGNAVLCSISEGVAAGYCTASILGVLLIAVDQYYAVVDPLRYHSKVDGVRSAAMLAAAWLCALLAAVLGALEPRGAGLWASCDTPPAAAAAVLARAEGDDAEADADGATGASLYRRVYAAAFAILVFVVPFAALCWIYVSIYSAAHRNSQRTRRNGSGSVAPSTPPPELSCSECGPGLPRSVGPTPSSTLSGHARAAPAPAHGLPVSRSAPAMDAMAHQAEAAAGEASSGPGPGPGPGLGPGQRLQLPASRRSSRSSVTSAPDDAASLGDSVSTCGSALPARAERRRSSCPHAHAVTVTISPPPPPLAVRSASAWLVSSLRCRISNASLFRYREEGRAARVSAIVVVMALGCWAPYVAVLVLHAALPAPGGPGSSAARLPRHLDALALAALAAAVCISPCLFAFRNRRVQKEVRRLLCPRGRKGSLERGRGCNKIKGRHGGGAGAGPGGGGGSARRLLPHNLMASLAEDCSTPSDSTSALTISGMGKGADDDASALTVSVSLLPAPLWAPHLLPDDALAVETARSSFSSGASSSQGSALSTDTADE